MDNDFFKNLPIATILLIYLFVCGILYLLGFWETFNIDIFSLISTSDIPKNFAFPLLVTQGLFFLNFITGGMSNIIDDNREDKEHFITIKPEWGIFKKLLLGLLTKIDIWVILTIALMMKFLPDYKKNEIFWSFTSIIIAYYLMHKFVNLDILKSKIQSSFFRYLLAHFVVFFPISCFSIGKVTSLRILYNADNTYITIINNKSNPIMKDTARLKLLGFISDRVIYSTLDNKKTYILNKESCDGVILTK